MRDAWEDQDQAPFSWWHGVLVDEVCLYGGYELFFTGTFGEGSWLRHPTPRRHVSNELVRRRVNVFLHCLNQRTLGRRYRNRCGGLRGAFCIDRHRTGELHVHLAVTSGVGLIFCRAKRDLGLTDA